MEYDGLLSILTRLCFIAASLVAQFFLSRPSFFSRNGNVFFGAELDRQCVRGKRCRDGLCFQWPHLALPDVAQQHCRTGVDAIGRSVRREWLEEGWQSVVARGGQWRAPGVNGGS